MVTELIAFSVDKTVVGKEPDLGCYTGGEVVDMIEKEDKTENCALRDSRLYRDLVRGLAFQSDNLHTPLGEEGCEPDVERPLEGLTKAEDGYVDFVRVPGEIKRSRDLRGGRWSWTLTFAQKLSLIHISEPTRRA